MLVKEISSLEEYPEFIQKINEVRTSNILLLKGDLGSGKTTFTQVFIKELNSSDNVSSPTFSIVNQYESPLGKIYHFDLYRINSLEELLHIGFEEYLDDKNATIFIEWPDIALPILPDNCHILEFEIMNKSTRRIIFN